MKNMASVAKPGCILPAQGKQTNGREGGRGHMPVKQNTKIPTNKSTNTHKDKHTRTENLSATANGGEGKKKSGTEIQSATYRTTRSASSRLLSSSA